MGACMRVPCAVRGCTCARSTAQGPGHACPPACTVRVGRGAACATRRLRWLSCQRRMRGRHAAWWWRRRARRQGRRCAAGKRACVGNGARTQVMHAPAACPANRPRRLRCPLQVALVVRSGRLRVGDPIVVGTEYGRVRGGQGGRGGGRRTWQAVVSSTKALWRRALKSCYCHRCRCRSRPSHTHAHAARRCAPCAALPSTPRPMAWARGSTRWSLA